MDFRLTDEEEAFQEAVRRFGDKVLRPNEGKIDTEGRIPPDVLAAMADLGLLAMPVTEEFGGMGASAVLTEIAAEEVGRGDSSMATAVFFLLEAGWGHILCRHGTDATKREVLPAVCAGKAFLGVASTEPTGGSDLAAMKTTSRREGDSFVLHGEKSFISGVEEAKELGGGHLTLTKATAGGFNFLYVPTRTSGIATQRFHNMGRMGISTGGLSYQDARVPAKYLLGAEGRGRNAFGQPLGKFEGIQFELVDLWTQVEAVKWQCRRAAWLLDQYTMKGDRSHRSEVDRAVAAVKLTAPPLAFECVKRVMTWFGAAGYTKEVGLELGFRGVMSYVVGAEGGLNIMRIILGRELLGKEFVPYK
jgi:acyl-CoA dehydrogenase